MHITLLAYGQLRVCEIRSKFGRKESAGFQYLAFKYLLSMEQQVNSFINSFVDYIFRFSNHTKHKNPPIFHVTLSPSLIIFSTFPGLQARYSSSIEDVGLAGVKAGEFLGAAGRLGGGKLGAAFFRKL